MSRDSAGERAGWTLRPATLSDAQEVAALVDEAYRQYLARMGGPPGPMTLDYRQVIAARTDVVAEQDGDLVGVLVMGETPEGFAVDNVAVGASRRLSCRRRSSTPRPRTPCRTTTSSGTPATSRERP